ncbi:ATP-binding protein [Thermophagus sp. OGC60D27]|uniref:ATP-binding protein n=1 Tax=Thermophagus sp. OGC60D27 TaxID=3458415 RepID=UPI0040377699
MNKQPYIIQKLHIQKLPGIPNGLKPFDNLAPNINIVSGPNASGKSSTARIIQQLIWPGHTNEIRVNASVLLNNRKPWEINIDADHVMLLHDGKPDTISGLPAAESSHRYLLALQDMISEEETEAAQTIIRESIGGYDLEAAKNKLDYTPTILSKNIGSYKHLEEIIRKFHNSLSRQEKIKREEENLTKLYKEKEDAELAGKKSSFYKLLSEYLTSKNALIETGEVLKTFHPSMEKISGKEPDLIEKLELQIKTSENSIARAQVEIEQNTQKLNQLTIPESGLMPGTIEELENRTVRIAELHQIIHSNREEIAKLEIRVQEALNNIDHEIDPSEWQGIDLNGVGQLDHFLQKATPVLNKKTRLKAELELLEDQFSQWDHPKYESDKIKHAISTLNSWLTEHPETKETPQWLIPALVIAGSVTVLVTFFIGWPGLIGIALLAGLWVYSLFAFSGQDKLKIREDDFLKSGITPPAEWKNQEVVNRINELVKELHDAKKWEEITEKKRDLTRQLSEINIQLDELRHVREKLIQKIKVVPGISDISENDFQSLAWLIDNIKKWQDAHLKLISHQRKTEQLQAELNQQLEECNRIFTLMGFEEASDLQQIKARLSELKTQEKIHNELTHNIQQIGIEINYQQRTLQTAKNELNKIYSELNFTESDKNKVLLLCGQLNDFKYQKDQFLKRKAGYEEKKKALESHPLFSDFGMKTTQITPEEASLKAEEFARIAENWESIINRIKEIENSVKHLTQGHELEEQLAQKETALDALQNVYLKNMSGITGHLIVEELKEKTRDQNRPQVFKGANKLFNKITAGRYELRLNDENKASFSAYDTLLKREQPLSELSTGTRIQLLLAVKLAFIEKQEESIKLPLLVDELLANSDDERAAAIIRALIAISEEGRQIFYFTAQDDEVRKWLSFLKQHNDVGYSLISLAEDAPSTAPQNQDLQNMVQDIELFHALPSPEGKSLSEYARSIEVPSFDILSHHVEKLHLWFLAEDEDVNWLHQCLCRGIRHWGQLHSYIQNNGIIPDLSEIKWQDIKHKAELLSQFQELFSIGRPKPVNREILLQSGHISHKFIDSVTDKLVKLKGNPQMLLQALQNGEITGFRKAKIQELEEFFIQHNYIDENEPLPFSEILIKLQAFISENNINPISAEKFLKKVISYHQN